MMSQTAIEKNIAAAKEADELLSLVIDEKPRRFWERLRDIVLIKAPLPALEESPQIRPMTDTEAKEFEKEEIKFGKYACMSVGIVYENDKQYLHWLAGVSDKFHRDLSRYLRKMDF